jgi:regulator of ribosome biosynthesis
MSLPAGKTKVKLDVAVERPTPYTFDLGLLLANDANPITTSTPAESSSMGVDPLEAQLIATARDGAQGLISTLSHI